MIPPRMGKAYSRLTSSAEPIIASRGLATTIARAPVTPARQRSLTQVGSAQVFAICQSTAAVGIPSRISSRASPRRSSTPVQRPTARWAC